MLAPPSKNEKKSPAHRQTTGAGAGKAPSTNSTWQRLAMRPVGIQTKLTVSQPGDALEQEADRVADHVMCSPEPQLQRACACGSTCPECETQANDPDKQLQTKHVDGSNTQPTVAPGVVQKSLDSSGQPLDPHTQTFMETRFGHDFSGVRVHNDKNAAEAARDVTARAFTTGSDIVFGANEYQPGTLQGQKLIAHELTHVVQQNGHGSAIQRAAGGAAPSWTVAELTALLDKCDGGIGIREKARKANDDTEPAIVPGDGGSMDADTGTITLDRTQDKCFAVQQLIQELSNLSHKAAFQGLFRAASSGDLSRDAFIKGIELIEYETGVKNVLTAFDACKDQWPCTTTPKEWARPARDFSDYYDNYLGTDHKEHYGKWWDDNARVAYDKKSGKRGKTGAPATGTEATQGMRHVPGLLWATDASGKVLLPALEDIRQGSVNDCFLFAAMAAIVNTQPEKIFNMIQDHGDDSYTVTFEGIGFLSSAEQKVTADFPVGKHGKVGSRKAIWPLVIEKAYAQEKGGIDKLDKGGSAASAIDDMLDVGPSNFNPQEKTASYIMGKVAKAKKEKWPMTISVPKPENASKEKKQMALNMPGFYFWHAYAIIDVDAKGERLKLFNPFGHSHPNGDGWVSVEQVQKLFINISIND